LKQKYEDRTYLSYTLNSVMAEKQMSYVEYREKLGLQVVYENYIDTEENQEMNIKNVRLKAQSTLDEFKNLMKKGADN
jgi:hypothetical protein